LQRRVRVGIINITNITRDCERSSDNFARSSVGWINFDISRRAQSRRSPLIARAARIGDAQIVLGMLTEIFRGDAVAADCGFPREANVPLKYLIGASPNLHIGTIAFEEAISLGGLERSIALIAPARIADLTLVSFFLPRW
jgi:hypothetical protein